jgi:endonuclease/exonuclease/phosphatase family metal-dependent hydrolase
MQLTLLTYNIHRAIGLDRRFRLDRIVEILRHHDADVVLLQEVDEGVPRSRELHLAHELAAAAGYPYFAYGRNVSLRKGHYGNATLSRLPILRERNIDLTIDWRKRRGCQHTTLVAATAAGERHLDVFNLHLGLSARERQRQIELLLRSAELTELAPQAARIVAGDFNDWRSLLVSTLTGDGGLRCLTDGERTLRTYPSFLPRGALDRIYVRGGLHLHEVRTSRLSVAKVASDHLPLIAELVWSAPRGESADRRSR